jgi:membrane-associated phospholipid phosphatase
VFGAMPSLHVGQTFLAVLFAWRSARCAVSRRRSGLVCFASVYLNHHYVIDGLAGMALALGVWAAIEGRAWRGPAALRRG